MESFEFKFNSKTLQFSEQERNTACGHQYHGYGLNAGNVSGCFNQSFNEQPVAMLAHALNQENLSNAPLSNWQQLRSNGTSLSGNLNQSLGFNKQPVGMLNAFGGYPRFYDNPQIQSTYPENMSSFSFSNWHNKLSVPPGFEATSPLSPNYIHSTKRTPSHDTFPIKSCSVAAAQLSSATQTECDSTEEKFFLCQTILKGCTELKKMKQLRPGSNISEYCDDVRENVLCSLSNNNCSQMDRDATEQTIITEYAKSFIRLSECWLGTGLCFGVTDRCTRLCRLETSELTSNYADWMQSSRRLLVSILDGLQKINMMYMTDPAVFEDGTDDEMDPNCIWNGKKTVDLEKSAQNYKSLPKYAGQTCSLLPIPPQAFVSVPPLSESEYMEPASYNVPRTKLTQSKKKKNITNAKIDIVSRTNKDGAYLIALPNSHTQRVADCNGVLQNAKEKVYQIAVRKKESKSKEEKKA